MRHLTVAGLVLALAMPSLGHASPLGVVKESGRTAGHAIRDGALTFGRTTRDFFVHGSRTARRTWDENAEELATNARRNTERVKAEAEE
jgi:hypothetical protein